MVQATLSQKNKDSIKSQVSVSVAPTLRELGLEYDLSPGVQDQLARQHSENLISKREKERSHWAAHSLKSEPSSAFSLHYSLMDKEKQRNDDRYFKDDLLETLWGKGATNQLSCGVKNIWNSAGMNLSVCSNPCLSI